MRAAGGKIIRWWYHDSLENMFHSYACHRPVFPLDWRVLPSAAFTIISWCPVFCSIQPRLNDYLIQINLSLWWLCKCHFMWLTLSPLQRNSLWAKVCIAQASPSWSGPQWRDAIFCVRYNIMQIATSLKWDVLLCSICIQTHSRSILSLREAVLRLGYLWKSHAVWQSPSGRLGRLPMRLELVQEFNLGLSVKTTENAAEEVKSEAFDECDDSLLTSWNRCFSLVRRVFISNTRQVFDIRLEESPGRQIIPQAIQKSIYPSI